MPEWVLAERLDSTSDNKTNLLLQKKKKTTKQIFDPVYMPILILLQILFLFSFRRQIIQINSLYSLVGSAPCVGGV